MLFRIAFMVDEKRLGATLAAVHKLKVVNMEPPSPVTMVDDRPYTELVDFKGRKKISVKEVQAQIVAAGRKPSAISYALRFLVEAGVLRATSKRGIYDVVRGGK